MQVCEKKPEEGNETIRCFDGSVVCAYAATEVQALNEIAKQQHLQIDRQKQQHNK